MVYTIRWVQRGHLPPPAGGAPEGPRPEKVKYPGMRETSIVKPTYRYSFKLYIGPLYYGRTYLHTYLYKFIYYADMGIEQAGWTENLRILDVMRIDWYVHIDIGVLNQA